MRTSKQQKKPKMQVYVEIKTRKRHRHPTPPSILTPNSLINTNVPKQKPGPKSEAKPKNAPKNAADINNAVEQSNMPRPNVPARPQQHGRQSRAHPWIFPRLPKEEEKFLYKRQTGIYKLRDMLGYGEDEFRKDEFRKLCFSVREIAWRYLDCTKYYDEQDTGAIEQFVRAACEKHPYFADFEGQWPLQLYMSKYISQYMTNGFVLHNLKRLEASPTPPMPVVPPKEQQLIYQPSNKRPAGSWVMDMTARKGRGRVEISLEMCVRPSVNAELRLAGVDSRVEELQAAMGLEDDVMFGEFIAYLHELTEKHLWPDKLFCEQDEWAWRAFVKEACVEFPFANRYEDHWPIEFHMKKYLESRFDALALKNVAQEAKAAAKSPVPARGLPAEVTAGTSSGVGKPKFNAKFNAKSKPKSNPKPKPVPSPPRRVLRSIQPALAGTQSISDVELVRKIQGQQMSDRVPAMKKVRELLGQFCNDGKITEGQYNMLLTSLQRVLAPYFLKGASN